MVTRLCNTLVVAFSDRVESERKIVGCGNVMEIRSSRVRSNDVKKLEIPRVRALPA